MISRHCLLACALVVFAAILVGCATPAPTATRTPTATPPPTAAPPPSAGEALATAVTPAPQSVLRDLALDKALEDRILALDPEHISDVDLATTLSKAPAPRIVMLHGGIFPTHLIMASAGRFLVGMGYPENRIRHPGDRSWSHSPYEDSARIAGHIAWYYEHDGLRPMMIGHSQGGIQAVKVLYELTGKFDATVPVWNPYTDQALPRTTIVDPLTGVERPVVGLTVSYASVVGAGGAAVLLPNQWSMAGRVHTIPDTVEDFTGFSVGMDFMAWSLPGINATTEFKHNGTAQVRSVALPSVYNHLTVPVVGPLIDDPATRSWINAYAPEQPASDPPAQSAGYATLWAADVWYSVKKHWVLEAQRLIRARRAVLG